MLTRARRQRAGLLAVFLVTAGVSLWPVLRPPIDPPAAPLVINDVSQLNPIHVSGIITQLLERYLRK